ncbi:MAG: hypothetical protein HWN81_00180 [Candidatus Lokiarchaeota archaeon]|nr:hypothetical protein [Candidatus Lokiarchaeota archaeon]
MNLPKKLKKLDQGCDGELEILRNAAKKMYERFGDCSYALESIHELIDAVKEDLMWYYKQVLNRHKKLSAHPREPKRTPDVHRTACDNYDDIHTLKMWWKEHKIGLNNYIYHAVPVMPLSDMLIYVSTWGGGRWEDLKWCIEGCEIPDCLTAIIQEEINKYHVDQELEKIVLVGEYKDD